MLWIIYAGPLSFSGAVFAVVCKLQAWFVLVIDLRTVFIQQYIYGFAAAHVYIVINLCTYMQHRIFFAFEDFSN